MTYSEHELEFTFAKNGTLKFFSSRIFSWFDSNCTVILVYLVLITWMVIFMAKVTGLWNYAYVLRDS